MVVKVGRFEGLGVSLEVSDTRIEVEMVVVGQHDETADVDFWSKSCTKV